MSQYKAVSDQPLQIHEYIYNCFWGLVSKVCVVSVPYSSLMVTASAKSCIVDLICMHGV